MTIWFIQELIHTVSTNKKIEYYSLDEILKRKAVYNLIIGERSNGKTYAALKYGLEEYLRDGKEIAIVRRWKEDITGRRARAIWDGIESNNVVTELTDGEYEGIYYYSGRYYLCNYEDGKAIYNENDVFAHVFALSDTEHNKGVSHPKVGTIIFDEFITKGTYLRDEFVIFMNTVSTIVRKRTNVQIFMLGNTVNKFNPYFKEMGLTHASLMKQGTIDLYKYGKKGLTVAIEYSKGSTSRSVNDFYFAFDNSKLDMITDGAWELDMYPHVPVKYKPKNIMFVYFIIFNDQVYQCELVSINDITFTYIHEKTTPLKDEENDLIYTFEYQPRLNYSRNIYKPINKLQQKILWYFNTDRVFYQDNSVGDAISNYLKVCKQSQ